MDSYGGKLTECRKLKNLSRKDLAALLKTSVSYILEDIKEVSIFKDPVMLNRFNDIEKLDPEKKHLLSVVGGFVKALKFKNIATL
jgi:ribosome-binding protein aMBF1 (putative translation factor)